MKIINILKGIDWIKKVLKWIKEVFDIVKWILLIVSLITSFGWLKSCSDSKDQKQKAEVLSSEVIQYKTENNQIATDASIWKLKYSDLEKYSKTVQSDNVKLIVENSRYKRELIEANKTIEDLEIKAKNVQNYIKNELVSKDSIRTDLVFLDNNNIEIKPIDKKHIKIDFIQNGSFLDVKYLYTANVQTVISRYPELKSNGKKHFPNWGFIWGWNYKTTSVIDDPNAVISNLVSIEFDK